MEQLELDCASGLIKACSALKSVSSAEIALIVAGIAALTLAGLLLWDAYDKFRASK